MSIRTMSGILKRKRWWQLLKKLDDTISLSNEHLGDLLLDSANIAPWQSSNLSHESFCNRCFHVSSTFPPLGNWHHVCSNSCQNGICIPRQDWSIHQSKNCHQSLEFLSLLDTKLHIGSQHRNRIPIEVSKHCQHHSKGPNNCPAYVQMHVCPNLGNDLWYKHRSKTLLDLNWFWTSILMLDL